MVKSIEEYIAETTKSYQPSIDQYNSQIAGLDTSKASDLANLERSYASQQEGLERQKNRAAETASLAAAARGGAFGGASNIARRNYYEDTFVPAVTQLNSNKASSEETLNKNYNERRSSLEQQLANLYSQANTYGTQRYDDALKQEEAIRQYNENLALQKAQQEEAIRQYNESLALQKAQQEEAIRQYNENLALEKAKLEESKRQANLSARSAASSSLSSNYLQQAIDALNAQYANQNEGRTRMITKGPIPIKQIYQNGQWVDLPSTANASGQLSKLSSIVSNVINKAKNSK